ncbi:MAG: Protein YobA [Paracidovorax wautersii]|uniref:Protein YobA n=1 Tax=Paracidovorax wautersii TaxID=1177982 RepID=A0A7V8FNF7_9BURK|nr:MAG: Protein YobA [Paracidovorax wautersii]
MSAAPGRPRQERTAGEGTPVSAVLLAALGMLAAMAAPPVWAHAHLGQASPASGARLQQAPEQVVLRFTEPLEAAFSAIEVSDAQGHPIDPASAKAAPGRDARELRLALPASLPAGRYTVKWKATSVDTHTTTGRYDFTIAP